MAELKEDKSLTINDKYADAIIRTSDEYSTSVIIRAYDNRFDLFISVGPDYKKRRITYNLIEPPAEIEEGKE